MQKQASFMSISTERRTPCTAELLVDWLRNNCISTASASTSTSIKERIRKNGSPSHKDTHTLRSCRWQAEWLNAHPSGMPDKIQCSKSYSLVTQFDKSTAIILHRFAQLVLRDQKNLTSLHFLDQSWSRPRANWMLSWPLSFTLLPGSS